MEYPRWHELNAANLTTTTAHTTDFVAIRELKSREQGSGIRNTGTEGARDRKCSERAARIVDVWG
jgi:hypothetical protein